MKYKIMLAIAFVMALFSSGLTAFGMMDLFTNIGIFILILFFVIDLGRFLLFNFVVDEWSNLRKVKYVIVFILALLFVYSATGIYSKLDALISEKTREAMINAAAYNKEMLNAELKQDRSDDYIKIVRTEYDNALSWNKLDYENCLKRANKDPNKENNCNNTKRRLDKNALTAFEQGMSQNKGIAENTEEKIKKLTKNKSEIANVLVTICKLTQKDCNTYDSLQNALTILIFLVIIGTDYLQIAIVLAVNTRKNKEKIVIPSIIQHKQPYIEIEYVDIKKEEIIKETETVCKNLNTDNNKIKFTTTITPISKKKEEKSIAIKNKENKKNPFKEKIILKKEKKITPIVPTKKHFFFGPKPK